MGGLTYVIHCMQETSLFVLKSMIERVTLPLNLDLAEVGYGSGH